MFIRLPSKFVKLQWDCDVNLSKSTGELVSELDL